MVKRGQYVINDMYQGGYSSLEPGYGDIFTGYHVATRELGAPTKADTANQMAQVNMLLNQGIIPIEVGAMNPDVFDQIPKQHFKEINRMAKLTGSDISVHAPIIEASGVGEQGWSESARKLAENRFKEVVDRTAPLNEKGAMSITIHGATMTPGAEWEMTPEGKQEKVINVINRETGQARILREEEMYHPAKEGIIDVLTPRDRLSALNETEWENSISKIMHDKEDADARIEANIKKIPVEILKDPSRLPYLDPTQRQAYNHLLASQQFLRDARLAISGMFDRAYKYGTDEDRAKLKESAKIYQNMLKKNPSLQGQSDAVQGLLLSLGGVQPQLYQPAEDFAREHASKTFANVALHAFEKYKDKAPTINIENLYPGIAFSHGEEMDNLIKETRKNFVDLALEKGYSKSQAEAQAEKMIGVTLDVGHLNIARKKGFKTEDIMKEVAEIAKHVKHVHLTDNFGYSDSHLPPGMGNVAFKEILERLEQEGYEGKKVVEAPGWPQHFGTSPYPFILEGMGSPMFTTGETPYWNQAQGLYQSYSGGFGQMLPPIHYETFGAGFSQLPAELGGERPGAKGSRMSGKPME